MKIKKANGNYQQFLPNKILDRIKKQSKDLPGVNPDILFQKIIPSIQDEMSTTQIDEIIAFKAADMAIEHPDYSILGGRILLTRQSKIIDVECEPVDLSYDIFGAITFLKKYSIINENEAPIEIPSMMYNRVSEYFGKNQEEVDLFNSQLKDKKISVATPILTNAGTKRNCFISCNLTVLENDSLEGIQTTLTNIAKGSKEGSGIGLLLDSLRSRESLVSSFNGKAGGIVRVADMVQSCMRFYKQGNRSGSAALYLSVWHRDIIDFLELRLQTGDEKQRTRDLFTAVIINDNFMRALINNEDWYLFCPNDIKKAGLRPFQELWGEEYEAEYNKAVELGLGYKTSPKKIWDAIITCQVQSGTPYVMFKDNANRNNMQSNIGPIMQSNLCVAPDTKILTDMGEIEIQTVQNKSVNVWNGMDFSEVIVRKTGVNKRLLRVTMTNGLHLDCTPEHRFYMQSEMGETVVVNAKDLIEGDKTIKFALPLSTIFKRLPDDEKRKFLYKYNALSYYEILETVDIIFASLTIKSITPLPSFYDTYCFHEPKRNMGMFNGILTGQCIEVMEASKPGYTAQCTLALVNLKEHSSLETIRESTKVVVRLLNRVIDKNVFPDEYSQLAGLDQRALAIGVAGLADFFAKKEIPFTSDVAKQWNKDIFETMYFAALEESSKMADEDGVYPAWEGSPYSQGITLLGKGNGPIKVRNSLFLGLMPSASTSILLGAQECFEAFTSNVFVRSTGSGEFIITNKYLVEILEKEGLWTPEIRDEIIYNEGSIQNIDAIPQRIKDIFKTMWELPMREIINMAADRQQFIDQSQSMNLYFGDADYAKISGALRYGWEKGLKTGVYYTRTERKTSKPKRLYSSEVKKPIDSPFECFGCTS